MGEGGVGEGVMVLGLLVGFLYLIWCELICIESEVGGFLRCVGGSI